MAKTEKGVLDSRFTQISTLDLDLDYDNILNFLTAFLWSSRSGVFGCVVSCEVMLGRVSWERNISGLVRTVWV